MLRDVLPNSKHDPHSRRPTSITTTGWVSPGWRSAWWLLLLPLLCVAAGPPQLVSGHEHPLRLSPGQILRIEDVKSGPMVGAAAAALVDRPTDTVLWSQRGDESLPMASTTKLMTVLVALETLAPDQIVTVPPEALIGEANMGLQAGEEVRVEALLYGALLPSANDAAMTLAIASAGSEAAFVARMNQHAEAWGLTHTHFENPHGLDAPGHVSSALDLIALARRALADPLLSRIVATPKITIDGFTLTSTNELLTTYAGAIGVKTGTTDLAGQVLVGAAHRRGGDPVSAVLASSDRYADSRNLLDFYFQHWRWTDPALETDALNRVRGPDGTLYMISSASQPLFLQRWQAEQLHYFRTIHFDAGSAPAGVLDVWLGEDLLAELPLSFHALPPPFSVPTATTTPES